MPKLWNETIEAHRTAVRDAIIDTTAGLVGERGLAAVTMSQIAEEAGIGRATLYKYFADVEAILDAWHERQIGAHLAQLAEVRDRASGPGERLEAVLETYALIAHEHQGARGHDGDGEGMRVHGQGHGRSHGGGHHGAELAALLHRDRGEVVARAREQLTVFIRELVVEGARVGELRGDVAAGELATYCLHALTAASGLTSKAAVRRLVAVTLDGLRRRG